jgi:tRNA modification GTPase
MVVFERNKVYHGYIADGESIIDEALLTVFLAPNSYTGEDIIEISIHGGRYIYSKVSNLLHKSGAEFAEPGEFTKRAYLNGKLDLLQAEAVADIIQAKTHSASSLALKQLTGHYSKVINLIREDLINYCSLLELELDFSEEGIDIVSRETLLNKIEKLIVDINRLTRSYESGRILKNGINLAIIGKPNVGKSSIFNYLLNENRAIVTEIPGTTRDYIKEPLIMGDIQFNLIDTAGIRETDDKIEIEGINRTHSIIKEADIIIYVEDITKYSQDDFKINTDADIIIYNKCDLINRAEITDKIISVSAKTGENMEKLQNMIIEKAYMLTGYSSYGQNSDIIITNERHRNCLLKSCEYLVNAKDLILNDSGNELISFEIRAAMDILAELIGKTYNVDILNNIFSKFCIGK